MKIKIVIALSALTIQCWASNTAALIAKLTDADMRKAAETLSGEIARFKKDNNAGANSILKDLQLELLRLQMQASGMLTAPAASTAAAAPSAAIAVPSGTATAAAAASAGLSTAGKMAEAYALDFKYPRKGGKEVLGDFLTRFLQAQPSAADKQKLHDVLAYEIANKQKGTKGAMADWADYHGLSSTFRVMPELGTRLIKAGIFSETEMAQSIQDLTANQ